MNYKVTQIVSLSHAAFFSIVTSALESYKIFHPEDSGGPHIPLETYGNLWGYKATTKRGESLLHVVVADVDVSAKRLPDSTSPAQDAFDLKHDFVDTFFPELEYLGDYHSHPYDQSEVSNELSLQKNRYHHRSPGDKDFARYLQENGRNFRLQLITTVFERENFVKRDSGYLKDEKSCIRFQYNHMTIWVKVYVFGSDGTRFLKVRDNNVALICPTIGIDIGSIPTE